MLAVLLSPVQPARAADCQSNVTSGNWSDTGSWTGCGVTGVPTSTDNVLIQSTDTITLDTTGYANNINIQGALTVSGSNALTISGNWSDSGTFTPSTGTVTFDGASGNQTITKSGGEAFYNLVVNKSSGNLVLNNNVTLSGNSGDVLTLTSGNIDLNANTMTLNGNGSYNIRVTGAARTITSSSGSRLLIYSNSGTNTITVASTSSGSLVFDTNVTLEISGLNNVQTGFDPGSSLTTINGTLKISWGGLVTTNGPSYGSSSTLIYNYANSGASATYNAGPEWPAGTGASNTSIPMNVQLNTDYPSLYSTTVVMPNNTIRTLRGNMTLGMNTTLQLPGTCSPIPSPPGYCGVDLYGNWYNNGGTLYTSSRTIGFKGTSLQTIGGSASTNFPTLRIDNSSNVVLAHVTVVDNRLYMATGNLDLAGFDLTLSSSALLYPTSLTSFNANLMVVADDAALCKIFSGTYDPSSFFYPIGDDTGTAEYTPTELNLDYNEEPYSSYSVCIRVIDAKHPNLDKTSYFTRYWKITHSQGDPTVATFVGTFYYQEADVVAVDPITEADFYSARFESNTSTWVVYDSPVITTTNTFSVDSVTMLNQADYTPYPIHPTSVTMVNMKAIPEKGRVSLEWTTAQETGVLGFSVYRSTSPNGSGRVPISDFIPGQAGSAVGADYEFLDTTAEVGVTYYYWIEALGSGGGEFFGPLEAILLNQIYLPILLR